MEDPSVTKRLLDFGIDEHDYDEVDEESTTTTTTTTTNNHQLLDSSTNNTNNNINNFLSTPELLATVTGDNLPPELPPPKQKHSLKKNANNNNNNSSNNNNNNLNKRGKTKSNKSSSKSSKIPRSPSFANTVSASGYPNFQPPPISGIPPQTPPLPLSYQNRSSKLVNSSEAHNAAGGFFNAGSSNNNNIHKNSCINNHSSGNIMTGGSNNSGIGKSANGLATANGQIHRNSANMGRRTPLHISSNLTGEMAKNFQYLTLTVRKDENGYGMKVSGDKPVFVESVKPGGAAQIAGLVAGDMILKVNGTEVRSEKHPTVVSLIKASTIVELAVKRSPLVMPATPVLSGRDRTASITGPQPVDSMKRREMETYKIQTLQKMLEQEKLNLERLKGDPNNPSYKLSEANIRTLREQLRQVGAEDAPPPPTTTSAKHSSMANNNQTNKTVHVLSCTAINTTTNTISSSSTSCATTTITNTTSTSHAIHFGHQFHLHLNNHQTQHHHHSQQQQQHHHHHNQPTTPQSQSSPAFLSLLPRSLSSLSLGGRKNKIDKDLISGPLNNTTDFLPIHSANNMNVMSASVAGSSLLMTSTPTPPPYNMSQSLHTPLQTQAHRNSAQQLFHLHQQQLMQQQQQQQQQQQVPKNSTKMGGKSKNKFAAQTKSFIEEDIPPPLPQRNPPRPVQLFTLTDLSENGNNGMTAVASPISDLDHIAGTASPLRNSPQPQTPTNSPHHRNSSNNNNNSKQGKRSKTKTKALSDPKMSTQMFLQMEGTTAHLVQNNNSALDGGGCGRLDECTPPPLPPRQAGMHDEGIKGSFQNLSRPPPNSLDTLMQYPLVATCTAVQRDNMAAAFPLSQRPNIVQQLQQHQQQQQQQQHLQSGGVGGSHATGVIGQTPHNMNHMNKHRRVVSSPDNMHSRHPERQLKTNSDSWELLEKDYEDTPPGTPPPPYRHAHSSSMSGNEESLFTPPPPPPHSNRIQAAQMTSTQKEIISMEDEDASDQEGPFIDENGPFNSFQRLLEAENVAFLAVFLNYVLSNSNPAPLLFYLITGLCKEGTAKDMRKWVYEIHSTFLVPRAPLSWYQQDEILAREVDAVLQNEYDKVEILRKVFWKSRKKARDIICGQLREFQAKRTAGLGTIYGPTDAQLLEAKGDKQREQHIFEETLLKKLQILLEEFEKDVRKDGDFLGSLEEHDRKSALCSALSTVIHRIFITRPNSSITDRINQFVNREKSFKSLIMGKKGKNIVRGHPLVLRQYYEVTHCNQCQNIIWGVSPQGFHCTDCKLNIHRHCSKLLEENCPGPLPQGKRKDLHSDKISKFMGKIRPRTSTDLSGDKRSRQEPDDFDPLDFPNERLHSTSIQRQPSDRRPEGANISIRSSVNNSAHNTSDLQSSFHGADSTLGATSTSGGPGALLSCNASQDGMATSITSALSGATANIVSGGISPGGIIGALNDLNAQDASESSVTRRERLHHQHQQNKSAPVSVNRSESYKERLSHKRNQRSQRKTSDPSLTSRPHDDQQDVGLVNSNFTASSNSSLSSGGGGSESPSNSMEQMGGSGVTTTTATPNATAYHPHHHHYNHHQNIHQDSFHGSIGGVAANVSFWSTSQNSAHPRPWHFDSEEDDDLKEADWSSYVAAEILAALTDAEKKRQEIINEIYQTERSHVRTLKLLERLFFFPLQESGLLSQEHLLLLFPPSLISLCDLHGTFEQKLKQRRVEHNFVVNSVGDLLAGMFDGKSGEELREYARQFCARQQIALEALKEKRRKDESLQKLLSKAEAHKACRRLQLKDLLPTVLQRLTKYPLLFENLYKVTIRVQPDDANEAEAIQKALESSKKILVDVNQAVKTAEDAHKLQNIQRKLDKSTFDKDEFKNLDLTQHRLIHDGSLTMKKNPNIQLHGLLFENMIVLLTKQDDKYSLKYLQATRNAEVNNKPVSPIMSIDSETLVRQEAADKNSFFLIKTKTSQMLELKAPSSSECKTWFKHISDAAEQYKPRSKNANHEPVDDPAIVTLPHSNTRESLEMTPERPQPQAATATVVTTPLAPILPAPPSSFLHDKIVNTPINYNNNDVQLRSARREHTPTSQPPPPPASADYYNLKQRSSHNELLLTPTNGAVNRTMSTRSCGEVNNNYSNVGEFATANGVALRHTQSARQANGCIDETSGDETNKCDNTSIIYSHNSNSTRTLMQPPLVDPKAIQISISPAHTAQPVLTPAEKLKRLDASIREGLMEKQKIICDMFRLPVEHFHEIVDIAAMPEAPKDSADIALAAYAQVQNLTEVINEYMQVKPEQEILCEAAKTNVCDKCYEKQQMDRTKVSIEQSNNGKQELSKKLDDEAPPPLPPPKKHISQAQQQTPSPSVTKLQTPPALLESGDIHEDDDGYCEIDELRLPSLPLLTKTTSSAAVMLGKTLQPVSSPPPPLPAKNLNQSVTPPISHTTGGTPELLKRQSVISADSIPEESADEVTNALNDNHVDTKRDEKLIESKEMLDEATIKATTPTTTTITKETEKHSIEAADNEKDANSDKEEEEEGVEESRIDNEAKNCYEENLTPTTTTTLSEGSITPTEILKDGGDDNEEDDVMHTAECESPASEDIKLNEQTVEDIREDPNRSATMSVECQQQSSNADTTIITTTTTTTITTDNLELALLHASEHMEINETYETLSSLQKANAALSMVDSSTQTLPLTTAPPTTTTPTPTPSTTSTAPNISTTTLISTIEATEIISTNTTTVANNSNNNNTITNTQNTPNVNKTATHGGPNNSQQQTTTTNTLEPSVPCHALSSIVGALNAQISLLLPKINERDMERERLRKENLHLRELLNAMHERLRVEAKLETPSDIATNAKKVVDEIDGFSPATSNKTTTNSTPISTSTPTHVTVNTSTSSRAATPTMAVVTEETETENTNNTNVTTKTKTTTTPTTAKSLEAQN